MRPGGYFGHLLSTLDSRRPDDLPDNRQQYGFDNLHFNFAQAGVISEGKCIARVFLPDYPITRIRTGQFIPESGQVVWKAETSVEE